MKTFVKVLVAILIVIGLCFGVYAVLPQTSKMFVKGNIQYRTDDTAKAQVDKILLVIVLKICVRAVLGIMKKKQAVTGKLHTTDLRLQWILLQQVWIRCIQISL